ncbi:MAG: hypothetical protein AUK47_25110 [Deltaproteobacteria bacterium CG2_30_63_29]|nr:MAG: hypothetical protein AUK47_25110 [Deltaproteobacteria bacterium CG2_30_63_29]PJB45296.1 MAG: hypothetical protein CO108_07450 [Deltaproteobacteria bacterium CG_4_9_14_3_um_filter_63_12]
MEDSDQERRIQMRTPTKFYASLSWKDGYATLEAIDLGSGGIRVKLPNGSGPLLSQEVEVEFEIPDKDSSVMTKGVVVHREENVLGISFDPLPDDLCAEISQFVDENGWLF